MRWGGVYSAPEGRPSYPPLTMVKILLLQQWYTLSDTLMEEALDDRISFRRFVGLGLEDERRITRRSADSVRSWRIAALRRRSSMNWAGSWKSSGSVRQGGDIDGRHAGGGAGQTPADERRVRRARGTPMRIGAARVVDHGHTSATRRNRRGRRDRPGAHGGINARQGVCSRGGGRVDQRR